jgi:predicted Zn-dependent peptidase
VNLRFEQFRLPNSLHVIHQIVLRRSYHGSLRIISAQRTNNRTMGFAHFFEHLMFEGSPNIPVASSKDGAKCRRESHAFTSFDQTVYFITVPSNQLELAMWMESERILNRRWIPSASKPSAAS